MTEHYFNLYSHGFARVAVVTPRCQLADPEFNADETIRLTKEAAKEGAALVVFPEMNLCGYSCEDLFHQHALLDACLVALRKIAKETVELPLALIVGLPLVVNHALYNCAAVISGGEVRGVVPKSYLPNYGEFYEARQMASAHAATATTVPLFNHSVPFGTDQVFHVKQAPLLRFHVEICEDVWSPIPPSCYGALAGATVLVNLSASNAIVGKSKYRHHLIGQQSARCIAAYLYASSGPGESTTDLAWDGHAMIYENGELLAESTRYRNDSQITYADIDLERLSHDRLRNGTFANSVRHHADQIGGFRTKELYIPIPTEQILPLRRVIERFPYVPADLEQRDERCAEVYSIQVQGLVQRLAASGHKKVVIGVSGGLDSTQALLVCAMAMDRLGLPRSNILAYTMPGFATSARTLSQARNLMSSVGCTAAEIDIRPSCVQMLKDLGHAYADGKEEYDVTFENVQAGERTSHLFRLANHHHAIVVGTGDLSELALGWCTYGVGDHMSHYNVNASVPKTLMTHLVRWVATTGQFDRPLSKTLIDVLETEISPELVPGKQGDAAPAQSTESAIGPYELQDFNLYYTVRYGFAPPKVAFLAYSAWSDRDAGEWPIGGNPSRKEYGLAEIKQNLGIFLRRFFQLSQFKRSCVPNGPKVGNGGSLSPRGDWRAPSDSQATVWMAQLERIPACAPPPGLEKHKQR